MDGFDSYMPEKWIDEVFAVPLPDARHSYKKRNLQNPSMKYLAGALVLFFSASHGVFMLGSTVNLSASKIVYAKVYSEKTPSTTSDLSPIGYIDKLFAAISSAETLPNETLELDPPIFV